ncbi:vWA domain-containing protein [Saccharophagus degradans]|uniref:vWA domain-containing protein n=1 Tax=Saccharophagus degradans TaxID=86304 RepID=UPI0024781AEA|nr:vWA domain-containing protein [Saccharophagus degradans]WGO97201.1 vWA domain-containing protein [Saccharophagus degradans]
MLKCWQAFIGLALMLGLVVSAGAQPELNLAQASQEIESKLADRSGKPADVRLVIDVSGSMKRNDPANLRQPAVDLLMQLLPEGSKAGVWTFGKWVNMLVPHQVVDEQWRSLGRAKASEINSVGLYTNIGEALEKAAYDLDAPSDEYAKHIILLTDGMVDIAKQPDKNTQEWRRIVDEVLPKLKAAGYTIHTVALSDNADNNLLKKLSLQTDGIASVAHTADDLMKIFLGTFDAAAPAEQVPLAGNQFVIDSSVEEFTALIFRKNPADLTELIGPDQAVYSAASQAADASWHRADNYDLITIKQPLEGEWGLSVDMDDDSRVTVVSNLNLRVKAMANNVYIGHDQLLSLVLQEDGKTITRPEFLELMTITAKIMAGNNEEVLAEFWQNELTDGEPPLDGRYLEDLPTFEKEGVYELTVVVDGKSFVREFKHSFSVRQPFNAEVEKQFSDGELNFILKVESLSSDVRVDKTQIVASITSPSKRKMVKPLDLTKMDTWQTELMPDDEGMYFIDIRIKGSTLDGSPFESYITDVKFKFSNEGGFSEEQEPIVDPAKKEEKEEKETKKAEPEEPAKPTDEEGEAEAQEAESEPQQPVPAWLLYSAIGIGNLLLFVGGYFIVRKLLGSGSSDEDLLEQFSEESVEEATSPKEEPKPVDDEEEPPMEDLDPATADDVVEEPEPIAEQEKEQEPEPVEEPQVEQLEEPAMDMLDEPDDAEDIAEPEAYDAVDDGIDDLDEMALEEPESQDEDEDEDEDDDMVAAMLKAQGLDLADDELDDAISNLIDDLDDDEEESK